jgi:hypothetical protein
LENAQAFDYLGRSMTTTQVNVAGSVSDFGADKQRFAASDNLWQQVQPACVMSKLDWTE